MGLGFPSLPCGGLSVDVTAVGKVISWNSLTNLVKVVTMHMASVVKAPRK